MSMIEWSAEIDIDGEVALVRTETFPGGLRVNQQQIKVATLDDIDSLKLAILEAERLHTETKPRDLNNKVAREGADRCTCGCKYWENDRCIDCGTPIIDIIADDIERLV